MGIIELPLWRLRGEPSERAALRSDLAVMRPVMKVMKRIDPVEHAAFCDRCAAPIEFGAVMNSLGTYCSVECSLDGRGRPA